MTRVYIADAMIETRSALRLTLQDLDMEVVGEAANWATVLAQAPINRVDMLLIDWALLPRHGPNIAIDALRKACPAALVIVLVSHLGAREQATISSGVDAFISKNDTPDRVAESLRLAAGSIHLQDEITPLNEEHDG